MAVGKRFSTSEPLTEHDVAERLSRSILRTLTILTQTRELGMMKEVKSSRYMVGGGLDLLAKEIEEWRH